MKNIHLACLAAALLLTAATCKNGEKTAQPQAAPNAPTGTNQPPAHKLDPAGYRAGAAFETSKSDTVQSITQITTPPQQHEININELPVPNASRRAYMATGWWFSQKAIKASDPEVDKNYAGKFLRFREDQTFDIIKGGKVQETGRWNFDDDKYVIYLSCRDPWLNNTWKVIEKGFTMIWLGQTSLNHSGIQVRIDNQKTAPGGQ